MSVPKKFDAAIGILTNAKALFSTKESATQFTNEMKRAVRVLEAAGKVDKAEALEALQDARRGLSHDRLDIESIVALIESLPDKEDKP